MRTESVPCRICGSSSDRVVEYDISSLGGYWAEVGAPIPAVQIRRCRRFGSYFTSDLPTADLIDGQYLVDWDEYYAAEGFSPERKVRRCLSQLARFVRPGSRVLDVGGGNGAFSLAAAARYDSWLHELAPSGEERLGDAGVTTIRSVDDAPEGTFDAITLWDVYEHVWPHDGLLEPIRRALAPTGLLIIEIPSPTRLVPMLLLLGLLSKTPRREAILSRVCDFSHLQLMTARELHHELRILGFEVVDSETHSELSYSGVVYARRVFKSESLAKRVGSAFEWAPFRRAVLGDNKTFVVTRPRTGQVEPAMGPVEMRTITPPTELNLPAGETDASRHRTRTSPPPRRRGTRS